jgi:hypothetical protein
MMTCISLQWIEIVLIWLVVIAAVVGLLRLIVPILVGPLGTAGATIMSAINIIVWAIVAIAIIILVIDLLSCLVGLPSRH